MKCTYCLEWAYRSPHAQEDLPAKRLRARLLQIFQQGLTHGSYKRNKGLNTRLGMLEANAVGSPVDVIQTQAYNFAGPQAISGQHQEHAVISQPFCTLIASSDGE
jgi:hypothetical protein